MTMAEYYDFEVSLADIQPRIWRRFLLSSDAAFIDLHGAIQDAFGWFDEHLWVFSESGPQGATIAGVPDEGRDDDTTPDARKVRLANFFDLGSGKDRCVYEYDFGDRWDHDVVLKREVQGGGDFFQKLLAGERACPQEDCGGVSGYERIVDFLRTGIDPDGEPAKVIAELIGPWQPDDFDLAVFREVFDR